MATYNYIIANSDPGGYDAHYTTLSALVSGESGNFGSGNTIHIYVAPGCTSNSAAVDLSGYAAAFNILPTAGNGFDGTNGASCSSLEFNITYTAWALQTNALTTISGIAIDGNSGYQCGGVFVRGILKNFLVRGFSNNGGSSASIGYANGATVEVGVVLAVTRGAYTSYSNATAVLRNVLVYNSSTNVTVDSYSAAPTVKNVIAINAGSGACFNVTATNCANNASNKADSTSPPGADPYLTNVSTSTDFEDFSGGDYHLASGSGLATAGINLYPNPQYDIDGDEFPSTGDWPIGFDHVAGGAPAFDETATVTGSVTVSATEAYTAPAYDETASVTAIATVEASETFGAGAYNETASIAATATVSATEAYTAPAYDETASVTAIATVEASETFGAGAYNETASIAATATVSATEAYTAPAYNETTSVTATATVTASEVFTEPGGAFDETADISAAATVSASESYTGPAYSETASITFAALVEASEIYVGPGAGETASITGTVTVDASETWEPPHYSETASIIGLLTVTAVHTFFTPSALPAGISRLSAERVGGFFAERIGRA